MRCDRELYWNGDRTVLVEESDRRQAFLALNTGAIITPEWLEETGCNYDRELEKVILPGAKKAEAPKAEAQKEVKK